MDTHGSTFRQKLPLSRAALCGTLRIAHPKAPYRKVGYGALQKESPKKLYHEIDNHKSTHGLFIQSFYEF